MELAARWSYGAMELQLAAMKLAAMAVMELAAMELAITLHGA